MTALLVPVLLALCVALRVAALPTVRASKRSDVLGVYSLHPDSSIVARPFNCPNKITTNTFEFQVTAAPHTLSAPNAFNIIIPHVNTLLDDRMCESSGNVIATTSDHPFVATASNRFDVVTAWAAAATATNASWVTEELVDAAARQPFVVGYDFTERSCRGVRLRPGTAFLWFQPAWDIPLASLQLTGRNKYLLLTFQFHRLAGCIYVADVVGGEGDFSEGPVSDPSVDTALENPDMLTDTPSVTAPPASDIESDGLDALLPSPGDLPSEEDDTGADQVEPPSEDSSSQQTDSSSTFTEPDDASDSEPSAPSSGTIFGDAGSQDDDQNGLQPASESDAPACFPASSTVLLEDGSHVQLRSLAIGHRVQVRKGLFSHVFFFSHRVQQEHILHDFVRIGTQHGHSLTLSEGHYLYVDGQMRAARVVSVGDRLQTADARWTSVVSVERVKQRGLYAPHTLHGDIVVDGIRVSTYTTAIHPDVAHFVLLTPLRLLYRLGVRCDWGRVLDAGVRSLQRYLPRGPPRFREF
ncbi:unnamed protein product [Agarophyton chilense]